MTELRRLDHHDAADRMLGAVVAGATSSEILGLLGKAMLDFGGLRSELDDPGRTAWGLVMADINWAYPPTFRLNHWMTRWGFHDAVTAKWLVVFVLAALFLASGVLYQRY